MKKEFLLALSISLIAILIANAPLIYFSLFHPQDLHFLGRIGNNSQNTYVYISFIEQSRQGLYSLKNLFTTENQPVIIAPTYVVIGIFASLFHISSVAAYHTTRVVFSFLLCISLYWFLGFFFKKRMRIIALLLLAFAGGVGYLFSDNAVTQLSQISLFGLLSDSPTLLLSLLLLIIGFASYTRFRLFKSYVFLAWCVLSCIPLSFINASVGLLMVTVLAALDGVTRKNYVVSFAIVFFLSLGILYQIIFFHGTIFVFDTQKILFSPSLVIYFSCYGLLVLLGLIGLQQFFLEKEISVKLLMYWIWINVLFLYLPFFNQQQVIVSLFVPVCIVAMQGFISLSQKLNKKLFIIVIVLSIILLPLNDALYLTQNFSLVGKDNAQSYYYYVSDNEYASLLWLKANTKTSDTILSNWFFGNIIPGIAGRRVYIGHQVQTENFNEKITTVNYFLKNTDDKSALQFLKTNGITFIFLGANDSMLQYGFMPQSKPYLKRVYNNGAQIYKVVEGNY